MIAAEALKAARAANIRRIGLDGDDLVLEAFAPPPPAVLDALSRHKPPSSRCCDRRTTGGRARTGGRSSTSGRASPSSMVACSTGSRGAGVRRLRRRMAEPKRGAPRRGRRGPGEYGH